MTSLPLNVFAGGGGEGTKIEEYSETVEWKWWEESQTGQEEKGTKMEEEVGLENNAIREEGSEDQTESRK